VVNNLGRLTPGTQLQGHMTRGLCGYRKQSEVLERENVYRTGIRTADSPTGSLVALPTALHQLSSRIRST
jgi:hypothetical protein